MKGMHAAARAALRGAILGLGTWLAVVVLPAAAEPLRIATEGAYPPFNEVTPGGEIVGFDVDIARALCRVMERDCVFRAREWGTIIDGLIAGDYDAIVASMSVTAERVQRVAFTNRYYSTPIRFIARREAGLTADAAGLHGRRLGASEATTASSYLRQQFGDVAQVIDFTNQDDANLALREGRIDATAADGLVLWQFLRTPEGSDFAFFGDPVNIDSDIAIALRQGDTELLNALNRALARIIADGTYEEINARYFPFSIY